MRDITEGVVLALCFGVLAALIIFAPHEDSDKKQVGRLPCDTMDCMVERYVP